LRAGRETAPGTRRPRHHRCAHAPRGRRGLALGDETLAPVLDAPETLGLARVALAAGGERSTDRFRVHLTHELADVLALAGECGAACDALRQAQCLAQHLRQLEGGKLSSGQSQQRFAQVLGGVGGAFAGALARPFCAPIITVVVVRSGRHRASCAARRSFPRAYRATAARI